MRSWSVWAALVGCVRGEADQRKGDLVAGRLKRVEAELQQAEGDAIAPEEDFGGSTLHSLTLLRVVRLYKPLRTVCSRSAECDPDLVQIAWH